MSRVGFVALILAGAGQLLTPLLRDTNSAAEVRRGITQYQRKEPGEAVKSFTTASKLRRDSLTSFNLGTAHVAAGNYADGALHLTRASEDPVLRPESYYNRGNSALAANALDHAVRDYTSALKLRPNDREAKRNLEIALLRKQATQRSQPQPQNQPSPQQQDQQKKEPTPGQERDEQSEQADPEALLRSVEQQEREELSRMRRSRAEPRRIGW